MTEKTVWHGFSTKNPEDRKKLEDMASKKMEEAGFRKPTEDEMQSVKNE